MKFKKSLGQHLLKDRNVLEKIVKIINPEKDEKIIEIGPGLGALTDFLYLNCQNLILIEKDDYFSLKLKGKYPLAKIVNIDFLDFDFNNLEKNVKYKFVGNLPYNVATQIIFKIIENISFMKYGVFMVQKEVAERMVSKHKSKNYSILSVISQTYCMVEKIFDVSPQSFIPKPKVFSSIIKLIPKENNIKNFNDFLKFVKAIFFSRRKKLINSLRNNPFYKFDKNAIEFLQKNFGENVRIENLSVKEIIEFYKTFEKEE